MNDNISEIDAYKKPTNHLQKCYRCSKNLKRDEQIIKILKGEIFGRVPVFRYFHIKCFIYCMIKTLKGKISSDDMTKLIDEMIIEEL